MSLEQMMEAVADIEDEEEFWRLWKALGEVVKITCHKLVRERS